MLRRHHYEQAFEHYLRSRAIPYVSVDEAKRALAGGRLPLKLKSFDFVVYSRTGPNLLVDVKGRKHTGRGGRAMQNWVTQEDLDGLAAWSDVFGSGFEAAFAFLFWCETQPPDALFQEMFEFDGKWYALLAVKLSDYCQVQRPRSTRWNTVSVPAQAFHQMAQPLASML